MQTKDEEREKRDFTVDTHAEQGRRARILMIVVVSGQPVGHQKGHKKLQCMSTIRTFFAVQFLGRPSQRLEKD